MGSSMQQAAAILDVACGAAGLMAGAEEDVGALGALDRAAGVLRDHQAVDRAAAGFFDPDRRAERDMVGVDGDRAHCGDGAAHGADGALGFGHGAEFAEEDVGRVEVQQRHAGGGVGADPLADGFGGNLRFGEDATADEFLTDRAVGMAVAPGIADADGGAIGHLDAARALDMQEKHLDRVIEPGDFEATPAQDAAFDGGAVIPDRAVTQFGRAAVDRPGKARGADRGAFEHGFVIAGEQGGRGADQGGFEQKFKERAGGGGVVIDVFGDAADRGPVGLFHQVAGGAKGVQGGEVVILSPALQLFEIEDLCCDRTGVITTQARQRACSAARIPPRA